MGKNEKVNCFKLPVTDCVELPRPNETAAVGRGDGRVRGFCTGVLHAAVFLGSDFEWEQLAME